MSKRLEETALEAYNDMFHNPRKMSVHSTCSLEEAEEMGFDYKEPFKNFFMLVYQQGYLQAEKNLGLTWKDMRRIIRIDEEMMDDPEIHPEWMEEQPYYEEVLRRFNKAKDNEQH